MKRIYLLGYPLGHSISPAMQNAALEACRLQGWHYEKLALPPDQLSEMLSALRADDCAGANVTIPHKQTIIPHLDGLSRTAWAIGAVNTIVKREGRLIGENTDAPGLMQTLRAHQIDPRNARVYLLGAGGAAAAVGFALAEAGAKQLVIINRTAARAVALGDHLRGLFPELQIVINDWARLEETDLVVNATAVGMLPAVDDTPLPANQVLPRGIAVLDLVYNPPETRLLREAAQVGARCLGGLETLIYQGARAFQMWTGREAPVSVMLTAAQQALVGSRLEIGSWLGIGSLKIQRDESRPC